MRVSKLRLGDEEMVTLFLVCRHSQSPWRAGGRFVGLPILNSRSLARELDGALFGYYIMWFITFIRSTNQTPIFFEWLP